MTGSTKVNSSDVCWINFQKISLYAEASVWSSSLFLTFLSNFLSLFSDVLCIYRIWKETLSSVHENVIRARISVWKICRFHSHKNSFLAGMKSGVLLHRMLPQLSFAKTNPFCFIGAITLIEVWRMACCHFWKAKTHSKIAVELPVSQHFCDLRSEQIRLF